MAGFSGHWAFAFGLLGNIVSFMVFLAPVQTFFQIYKKKTSEGFQSIPYVVALFSAMLWIYYALLKTDATFLITINSVGCFIETIYIAFHIFYAPKKSRVHTLKMIVILIACGFGFIVLSTQYLVRAPKCSSIVGWVCLVFSLCVFVAPLGIVRKVIQTKSVEYMPFLLSFFLTLSAVMRFFYGLLLKDFNIAIPNVLGFAFGIVQMVLYFMYKNARKISEQKLPEIQKETIILDERKFPELTQQIIDIVKLNASSGPMKIQIVPQLKTNGVEAAHVQSFPLESLLANHSLMVVKEIDDCGWMDHGPVKYCRLIELVKGAIIAFRGLLCILHIGPSSHAI